MKKLIFVSLIAAAAVLSGCKNDDVPAVPDPVPEEITVGDQTMSHRKFLETYCAGKTNHETCDKVSRAMIAGSTRGSGGVPRF